ncbi:PAS domain S-box-containing protein [Mucilaginibacter pineti]|uniref:histidine kinase n=1 Tax=Mucilaginibacter pineti TaxID=1391627 RepID=A0A1G7L4B2_9SPHI|nr:CHASE3 domain-containing protein [Mucilaginibacter pineti]SDF44196.1 PAS domain S-box-containing protein [Mucilaginibacter pineti]
MNRRFNRNLRAGYGFSIFILLLTGLFSWFTLNEMLASTREVRHSTDVIRLLEQTISHMKDAETGQRGYLLTGKDQFLDPYRGAAQQALLLADSTKKITGDNPIQQKNLQKIRGIITQRIAILQVLIEKHTAGQTISESDLDEGKQAMDQLRSAVSKAEDDERRLLNTRSAQLERYTGLAPILILAGIIFALFIAVVSYFRVLKDIAEKDKLYEELAEEKEETAALNEELTAANEEINAANEELTAINEELSEAREELVLVNEGLEQKVAERTQELAASEEETQALNEELMSINEELAASNEEITTTNEELYAANERLNDSHERFRFLLNAMPQQVWTATTEGALDYVNDVTSEDFGKPGDIIVGAGWQEVVHPEDLPLAVERWVRALGSGKEYLTEFRLKFADGEYYWHLARALPLVENGKPVLWVGTNTNIHQQKTNEYKKDEFLSIASHELKTPLTTIKAFFQLTKREIDGQSKIGGFIGKAERQLDRLGRLIEDLLDVSKINAGKMVYNKTAFEFNQMLSDVVEAMQETKDHQLDFVTNCTIDYQGDQHRIEQVVVNLLNNAIKYSPDGKKVIVRCELDERNIIVSIQDFGIGIPEEHLKGLFDRFYRVDNSSARFQGLGLGLFISAEIVKRHGGSFWIESKPGEGSTFSFLLPLSGKQEFTDIAGDGQSSYEGNFINMHYRPDGQYMDVEWTGYQNYDSVVKGCTILQELMQKNNCSKVINDNTLVKGNWSEASDWGAEVWFPAMAEAGLKKFAWIYSPSTFSRIAANVSLPSKYDAVQVAFFGDQETAFNWLQKTP